MRMQCSFASLCLSLALLVCVVEGTSDSNPRYLFTQHVSVDPEKDSVSEAESLAFYSDSEDTDSASVVSSSLLYDGGCLVSSQALMCNGGDMIIYDPSQRTFDSDYDNDSDDDDDDDDDDDGHSSMLSNASVQRARVSASGSVPTNTAASTSGPPASESSSVPSTSFAGHTSAFLAKNSALALRGGATAKMGSEFAKRLLVAAIVTLIYEACLGHALEFFKVVMQTSPPGTSYANVFQLITESKGIAGIWDGFVPWGVVQAVFKGGVFGLAHAIASNIFLPLADEGKIPKQLALTLAGGIAGGFQGYVLSPTLLLKTRVMTNEAFREKMSLWRTTMLSFRIGFDVVSKEGMGALMKGSNIFATKRVFDWATRFYFSDVFSTLVRNQKGADLTPGEKISCDLAAGFFSTLCTLPLDVLVSKTQDAKKAGVAVSAWSLFRKELDELGWAGLVKSYTGGFGARVAHVCFTTVAMKTGTVICYDALFGKKQ